MTFRKDPPHLSKEKVSSKAEPLSNSRPRNHHAPDPPQPGSGSSEGGGNGLPSGNITPKSATDPNYAKDPTEVCIVDLKAIGYQEGLLSYSPSSSGYSSLRHSTDTLTLALVNKETSQVHTHSSQYPYFGSASTAVTGTGTILPSHMPGPGGILVSVSTNSQLNGLNTNTWSCSCGTTPTSVVPFNPVLKNGRGQAELKKLHVPSTICEESDSSQRSRSSEMKSGSCL
jgi:hypothetical protein